MVFLYLQKVHLYLFAQSPSFYSRFSLLSKPKVPISLINPRLICAPKSTLSATETIPIVTSEDTHREKPQDFETQINIPIEKLFVPPETEVSFGDLASLSSRILKGSNIVLSEYARDSKVEQAEYVKSSVRSEDCPSDGLPEFALVGRSNVGKSSLLNSLVCRKRLALTSKKPGKTQCINHFRINDSWYLVDLPGYGYASVPKDLRVNWENFTRDYFLKRPTLVSVFLLIDASIPARSVDLEYAQWLGQNQIPMTLIFTKCDKRKKKKNGGKRPEENLNDFQELISGYFNMVPPWIMTSSVTNQGRDEILLHMAQLRNYWLKH